MVARALQRYGMILADNGSSWFISGAPDERWNNTHLSTLSQVLGSNFEAVDALGLQIDPNDGAARQTTSPVTVTPASATLHAGHSQAFSASRAARA